ncbi:ATPase, T2SS/T4P/T4SS family [Paraglaciecola sp.]|uniref:GspE/PulE family protein n=1 Tax=Paraglaciecola sp. TaxID=1920173 RepID=UPI0030F42988
MNSNVQASVDLLQRPDVNVSAVEHQACLLFEDRLLDSGILTKDELERARRTQRESDSRLTVILVRLGLISEQALSLVLASHYNLPFYQVDDLPAQALYPHSINLTFLKQFHILPLKENSDELVVALADPSNESAVQAMRLFVGKTIVKKLATPKEIESALETLYGERSATLIDEEAVASGMFDENRTDDIDRILDQASDAPVIKWVNNVLAQACEVRASDLHIEPMESSLRVRVRVDGLLLDWDSPPLAYRHAISSRIKVMAKLNIAERRLPQDGRIRTAIRGSDIDVRVSITPTVYGESVVLRILDQARLPLDFSALGFDHVIREPFLELLKKPHGILLVTGPTGSGKTTTLYASLRQLNSVDKKILTIEDPVEYRLPGINQSQIKPEIGYGFAQALRSFLRQDPDILMVGEIRDQETARIAVQAALTGHLVLSTIHTNDAASAVTRLIDMGIDDYLIASTVVGVLAQRLVRALCSSCKVTTPASDEIVARYDLRSMQAEGVIMLSTAVGCEKCKYTGYYGRTTLLELLPVSESLRSLLLVAPEANSLARLAEKEGMRTLRQHGLLKALEGSTTLEEVLRVV